jgi:hypothetical protein
VSGSTAPEPIVEPEDTTKAPWRNGAFVVYLALSGWYGRILLKSATVQVGGRQPFGNCGYSIGQCPSKARFLNAGSSTEFATFLPSFGLGRSFQASHSAAGLLTMTLTGISRCPKCWPTFQSSLRAARNLVPTCFETTTGAMLVKGVVRKTKWSLWKPIGITS